MRKKILIFIIFLVVLVLIKESTQYYYNNKNPFYTESQNDSYGHYRMDFNEVYFYYKCDNYLEKNRCKNIINDATPRNFNVLSQYIGKVKNKDGQHVVYQYGTPIEKNWPYINILDPEKLYGLEEYHKNPVYFSDSRQIYYLPGSARTEGVFPIKLNEGDRYYVPEKLQTSVPSGKFLVINDDLYLNGILIPEVDLETFVYLDDYEISEEAKNANGYSISQWGRYNKWFKDKNNVYVNGYKVKGADPKTISFVPETIYESPYLAIDKNSVFHFHGDFFDPNRVMYFKDKIDCSMIPQCSDYTCIKKNFCALDLKIPGIRSDGFKPNGYVFEYASQSTFFYDGKKFDATGKIIPE